MQNNRDPNQFVNLLTVDDVARILKVKKSKVYSLVKQRGVDSIPRIRLGKYLRFDPVKISQWLETQNNINEEIEHD